MRAAILALVAAFACGGMTPAFADERIAFRCAEAGADRYWGTLQTLSALPPDDYIDVVDEQPGTCQWVDLVDPRAQWDVHLDETGRLHTFQWPHPDVPAIPGEAFSMSLVVNAHPVVDVTGGRTYRLEAVIREPSVPEITENRMWAQVRSPGMAPEWFFSWTASWPPRWTALESGVASVSVFVECEQQGLAGGQAENPRGECHDDLVPYVESAPQRCGLGPELLLLGLLGLLWRCRSHERHPGNEERVR